MFGDVATEVCIRTDGDEGLFASYSDVQFLAPVRAGDILEVTAEVVAVGTPEEIYGDPADLFVADFVGTVNLIAGTPPPPPDPRSRYAAAE